MLCAQTTREREQLTALALRWLKACAVVPMHRHQAVCAQRRWRRHARKPRVRTIDESMFNERNR